MAGKSRQLVFEATAYIVGKKRIMDAWAQLAPCFFFFFFQFRILFQVFVTHSLQLFHLN